MGFGFDNAKLKGISPFSFVNVDTTTLWTYGHVVKFDLINKLTKEKKKYTKIIIKIS